MRKKKNYCNLLKKEKKKEEKISALGFEPGMFMYDILVVELWNIPPGHHASDTIAFYF